MDLSEHLSNFITRMKFIKESMAEDGRTGDDADVYTYIEVWRDDFMQMTISLTPDRDAMLTAMATLWAGTGADFLMYVHEAYVTAERTNPITGEEWDSQEMGWVHSEDPTKVQPALGFTAFNRDGEILMRMFSYEITDKKVIWSEPFEGLEKGQFEGVISDSIRQIQKIPHLLGELKGSDKVPESLSEWLVDDPEPEIRERRDYHMDMASLRAAKAHVEDNFVAAMMYAEPDSIREQCLQEADFASLGLFKKDLTSERGSNE